MPPTISLAGERVPTKRRLDDIAVSPQCAFDIVARAQPARRKLESFIAERYASTYGARIHHFAEHLVAFHNARGDCVAALGYTRAGSGPLFAEQYLDASIEEAISAKVGSPVCRERIVEVGNLAASNAGAARQVIISMTGLLNELACAWVVFTSTRLLLNSFARLNVDTIALAKADPGRLPDGGESWGCYYETDPRVIAANIPLHLTRLCAHCSSVAGTARH